jgi:hypothetical protein
MIYSLLSIIILSVAVLPGSAAQYENKQQYHAYATTTAAALPGFNFGAAGDWGCNSRTTATVNNIVDKNPELVLALGDYAYYGLTANCWFDDIRPIENIMKIAIGNHDIKGSKLTEYMEHFGLTSQYYSFNFQNVHFTVMADYLPKEKGSEQYTFVQNDLAKAAADPNIDWIVVTHHIQRYASTKHYEIPNENKWNNIYHPLFEQYDVDLVLQGDQHNYQRTYPIKYNSESPANPIITDKKTNDYTNPEGQIYLTVGTGGQSLFKLNGNKAPYLIITQDKVYGFLNVDVTAKQGGTTMLVGTFYKNNKNGSGEMTDQFTIAKSAAGDLSSPPPPPELPAQEETDMLDEVNDGDVGFGDDDAVVSEDSEDVDATDDGGDDDGGDDDGGDDDGGDDDGGDDDGGDDDGGDD